jgi:hypothetical protein
MKYRIKEYCDRFYPQYCEEKLNKNDEIFCSFYEITMSSMKQEVSFVEIGYAKNYINEHKIEEEKRSKPPIFHYYE